MMMDPKELLKKLTWHQKIWLTAGSDLWRTSSIEEHDVPYIKLSDGPSGARGGGDFNDATPSTLFPSPSCLGSTFDVNLAYDMGRWIGRDAIEKQCHVVLGPTVNIQRDPRAGRFFESYSEDAFLTGLLGGAWVRGCQSTGVGATMKHFVGNESETDRRRSNSIIDQTALREIYLEPFRLIMQVCKQSGDSAFEGQPSCVMTAYNLVNGVSASENDDLIIDILRSEWGFKGCVMSDWHALHKHAYQATDLEMPGRPVRRKPDEVLKMLDDAKGEERDVLQKQIDRSALKVLSLIKSVAPLGYSKRVEDEHEGSADVNQVGRSIRQIAAEGAVLLKNDNDILPLALKKDMRIACIGMPWIEAVQSGGGSANLTPQKVVQPLDALKSALAQHADSSSITVDHHKGCAIHNFPRKLNETMKCDFYEGRQVGQGKLLASESYKEATLSAQAPKPANVPKNNFWIRASLSFDAPAEAGDCTLIFGVVALGHVKATVKVGDSETQKDAQCETMLFEYILNPKGKWHDISVSVKAGQRVDVTCDYLPQHMTQDDYAEMRAAGLQIGMDVKEAGDVIQQAAQLARTSDVAIVLTALGKDWESEGYDRMHINLPKQQDELVSAVAKAAPGKTIVLNITGGPIELPWRESVAALVQTWYGGQEGAEAIVDVLLGRGDAPASGRLAHTWPVKLQDLPSYENFARTGQIEPQITYAEGMRLGYRHFDAQHPPAFHFGFGLGGYSTFTVSMSVPSGKRISKDSMPLQVHVQATNTGERSGKEIAQLYVKNKLVGFTVLRAKPGQTASATIELGQEAFSHWDQEQKNWRVPAETFKILLARSADASDVLETHEVTADTEWTWL